MIINDFMEIDELCRFDGYWSSVEVSKNSSIRAWLLNDGAVLASSDVTHFK